MSEACLAPPSDVRVEAALAVVGDCASVLVGVSGGPDSVALTAMAAAWSARRGGTPRVAAATVDHRLRPESGAEAAAVAALCARLGIEHTTLVWRGDKPRTRVIERAREARYALLAAHAAAVGAEALLVAHHADDQAETVLFRLLRGSGVAGLRGMDAVTRLDGLRLVRPLIDFRKSELVAYCRARGLDTVEDPTNADRRTARARLRAMLAEEGLDVDALLRLARRAREADEALARQTAEMQARLGAGPRLDAAALFAAPAAIAQRALIERVAAAGGRAPSRTPLEPVEALERALRAAYESRRAHGANVGGAMARLDALGGLTIEPENRRRRPADPAPRAPARRASI